MRRNLRSALASVQLGTSVGVHGEPLVGVDGHTEETRVCLQEREDHVIAGQTDMEGRIGNVVDGNNETMTRK